MTISYVSSQTAEATSLTMPSHQQWDLLLMVAHRHNTTTPPTIPSGWRLIGYASGGSNGVWLCAKMAASGSETSGTWTSADHLVAAVYRSDTVLLGVGDPQSQTGTVGSGGNVVYPSLAGVSPVTNKWLGAAYGHRSNDTDINTAPTGLSNRVNIAGATTAETGIHDSNANYSSWAGANYALTAGTSSGYKTLMFEIAETNITIPSGGGGGPLVGPGRLIRN